MARPRLSAFYRNRGWFLTATTGFFVLLFVGLLIISTPRPFFPTGGPFFVIEQSVRDTLARTGRKAERNPNIAFVAIDNATTQLEEPTPEEIAASPALQLMANGYPFNRAVYAYAIERLVGAGAKVVAFDMEYPAPRDGDEQFRAALEKYKDHVVIGCNLVGSETEQGADSQGMRLPKPLIPEDTQFDPRVGFVNFRPDPDYTVRRAVFRTTLAEWAYQPPLEGEHREMLSLAARMAKQGGFGDRIPRDHDSHVIRWSQEYEAISLSHLFIPAFWERNLKNGEIFKGKIILIGPFGNWAKDELVTPLGLTYGPHIHLSALNSIISGDYLHETNTWANIALIVGAGAAAWLLGRTVPHAVIRLFSIAGGAILYVLVAFGLYGWVGFYPIILSPLLTFTVSGGTWLGLERLLEVLERVRLRQTLEQYVSRDVVKEVLDNPQSYLNTLGGERKPITVLFSDVRGFTTITESAVPEAIVEQLREYFTAMVHIVFKEFGTLDKFMGDAVMAVWGAITTRGPKVDATRAVSAALQMLAELPKLNASWKAKGWPEFRIGLGVNHGEAICGRLGSDEKREFTAIGDAVNLASRLEGATKEFDVEILLGEGTAELVRDQFTLRTVGLLRVKGKTRPAEVFTVADVTDAAGKPAWLEPYEKGVQLFRQREFVAATQSFAESLKLRPNDGLTQAYLNQCQEFQVVPPAPDWDGVQTLTKK